MSRPYEVTVIGWLFIAAGVVSTAIHLSHGHFDRWTILIVLVGAIAVVSGVFVLRGANWARWLLTLWLAGHVIGAAVYSLSFMWPHLVLIAILVFVLFRPPASTYFHNPAA